MTSQDIRHIDRFFRDFIRKLTPEASDILLDTIVDLSQALARQHSCLDLSTHAHKQVLIDELKALGFTGPHAPITLHGEKLYLSRYYRYEKTVVERLLSMNIQLPVPAPDLLRQLLDTHFDTPSGQKLAALQALSRRLTIITGGPGTGKTTTISRIIDLIRELAPEAEVRLAAPTGKAAMRLTESITGNLSTEGTSLRVQTLHRLLGVRRDGRSFRFNASNPIAADILIIDEASMIDLAMMHRVLSALPDNCRLVLVGDPDQLPPVETGSLLADLCRNAGGYSDTYAAFALDITGIEIPWEDRKLLSDVVCRLDMSYRFTPDTAVGRLATGITAGVETLPDREDGLDVLPPAAIGDNGEDLLLNEFEDYLALLKRQETDPQLLFESFERIRILSPLRDADLGVQALNLIMEQSLEALDLKSQRQPFYHGRPILILRNDYNLQLYNGDIGICILDERLEHPMIAFMGSDEQPRLLLASRLPPHETCFAMTVHKSQGSEFDRVTLILPAPQGDMSDRLYTRELVYTAVTRARQSVRIVCDESTWKLCMANREPRVSGLAEFLNPRVRSRKSSGDLRQLSLFR